MAKTALELFIVGITVSYGPCLVFCSPAILSYIAGTKRGWKEGFWASLVFCLTRLAGHIFLGFLAGLSGALAVQRFAQSKNIFFLSGGLFISFLGIIITSGKGVNLGICRFLSERVVNKTALAPAALGLTSGILPCLPLLGVLAYIALRAQNPLQGTFYGLAFGLGTLFSPLIPLGMLTALIPQKLIKAQRTYKLFTRACGLILLIIGISLIFQR